MSSVVFLIEQIANTNGLYLLCGLVVLLGFRGLLRARARLNIAEFDLERELAARDRARAITLVLSALEVALGVFAVAHVVAPTIRADLLPPGQSSSNGGSGAIFQTLPPEQATIVNAQGTPVNPNDLNDPFLTLTAQPPDSGGPQLVVTATVSSTPPGTIEPGAPPPVGCTDDQAFLRIPANGQVLFESVTVIGTAHTANFSRYKFELSGPSTGNQFAPYSGDRQTAVSTDGVLGQLSLSPFAPGQYLFRLTVFDASNALKASCTVTVFIQPRPPTPTPSQTPPPLASPGK